ncbi:MAG: hypothetical protein IKX36_05335 [Prevotella sp.]|nr:hypothetical protein [Prevotella sp.]
MSKKTISSIVVLLLCSVFSWAQDTVEQDTKAMSAIAKQWTGKTIRVTTSHPNAPIHDYANALCSQFMNYSPCAAMVDYLKKPGQYTWEEKHYIVDDAPRNGYIQCDMGGQCDYKAEVCYWRRPNGHALVAMLMQIGSEGEGVNTVNALLFYDYNPKTRTLSPDLKIKQFFDSFLKKHKNAGTPCIYLPKENKDISVGYVKWDPEEDFLYENYLLKWTGNAFTEKVTGADWE